MISRLLAQSCRLCLSIFNPRFSLQFSIHLYPTLALLSSSLTPSLSSRLYNNRDEFLRADTFHSLPLTISSRFECLLGVGWSSSNWNIRKICWKKCRRDTCRYATVLTSILVIFCGISILSLSISILSKFVKYIEKNVIIVKYWKEISWGGIWFLTNKQSIAESLRDLQRLVICITFFARLMVF